MYIKTRKSSYHFLMARCIYKDAMRDLTKIDGHEPVESSMRELKENNLMRLYALMDQKQYADIAHFMD